jgi:uncharacterized protein YjiS (DUF1127 family)
MLDLAALKARFATWQAYRVTLQQLSQLSDRELDDIGVRRCDIPAVASRACDRSVSELAPHAAPRRRHAVA